MATVDFRASTQAPEIFLFHPEYIPASAVHAASAASAAQNQLGLQWFTSCEPLSSHLLAFALGLLLLHACTSFRVSISSTKKKDHKI